jgi:hypothetical protein
VKLDQFIKAAKSGDLKSYESVPWGALRLMYNPDDRTIQIKAHEGVLGSISLALSTPVSLQGLIDLVVCAVVYEPPKRKPRKSSRKSA